MKKGAAISVLVLSLVMILGAGVYAAGKITEPEPGVIVDGVYAGNINLSGLTSDEAKEAVNEYIETLEKKTITVVTGDHEDVLNLSEVGIEWTNSEIVDEAMDLAKTGNVISRFKILSDLKRENKVFDLKLNVNSQKLNEFVEETLKSYDQEAKEPTITKKGSSFVVTDEEQGLIVDVASTVAAINEQIMSDWKEDTATIKTTVTVAEPKHTASELRNIKDVLGQKTTSYSSSNVGRTKSLVLSTQRLDGTIIWPGETISVSTLMGERSQAGGYGTGKGYFGTNVEDTVGAGICQTASTLYNAALYAELDIVERYHHTLIVHYVDYGMDSTIYAGSDYKNPQKDLKLKNPYEDPIYIASSAGGGKCSFIIYGNDTRPSNRTVKYVSKTLSSSVPSGVTYTNDPTLPEGYTKITQEAYPAVKASLTKVVYIDGKETERKELYVDSYSGSPAKGIRGTKKPVETTPSAAPSDSSNGETTSSNGSSAETTKAPETTKTPETTKAPETTKTPEENKTPAE